MTTMSSALNMQSAQMGSGKRVVVSVVDNLNEGKITRAVDEFSEDAKFIDHALGLEFNDKTQLEEFFHKSRDLFPDTRLELTAIFDSGDHVIAEWILTATHVESYWPGREGRIRISLPGISVVGITGGRIREWSDYYDKITARRSRLADFFTEWIEQ